jgi:hypothetical protein
MNYLKLMVNNALHQSPISVAMLSASDEFDVSGIKKK